LTEKYPREYTVNINYHAGNIDKHVVTCYNYYRKEVKRVDDKGLIIIRVLQGLAYLAIAINNGIKIVRELRMKNPK
jgi:hypothetical protein